MTDAGFYRGTSTDQDIRFTDKQRKLLKQMRFEPCLETKVNAGKVNLDVIKPWITKRINEILGVEDDVVIEYVFSQLEDKALEPKIMQINLTGFLNAKRAREFMGELWQLMIDGHAAEDGIPPSLIESKMKQLQKQAETENLRSFRRDGGAPPRFGLDRDGRQRSPPAVGNSKRSDARTDWEHRSHAISGGRTYGADGRPTNSTGNDHQRPYMPPPSVDRSESEMLERQKAREQRHKEREQREAETSRQRHAPRESHKNSSRRHHSPPPAPRRRFTEEKGVITTIEQQRHLHHRGATAAEQPSKRRRFTEEAPNAKKRSPSPTAEKSTRRSNQHHSTDEEEDSKKLSSRDKTKLVTQHSSEEKEKKSKRRVESSDDDVDVKKSSQHKKEKKSKKLKKHKKRSTSHESSGSDLREDAAEESLRERALKSLRARIMKK